MSECNTPHVCMVAMSMQVVAGKRGRDQQTGVLTYARLPGTRLCRKTTSVEEVDDPSAGAWAKTFIVKKAIWEFLRQKQPMLEHQEAVLCISRSFGTALPLLQTT